MHESRVASRYAKSLIDFAIEKGILEEVKKDMAFFGDLCEKNHELVRVLKNPIIKSDKKKQILHILLKGRVNDVTLKFFDIVSGKGREKFLFHTSKEFLSQYRNYKGIVKAQVVSAYPITEDQRKSFVKIVSDITGKKVELSEVINENIIGGFNLTIGDRQIDETIKSKLQKLKSNFSYNPYLAKI
ncbi:ATP synthase F1 subunit delta [Cytophagaceae bacterium ABcell3]|nr:ATP synthase F1 subunit delta [Cytophagaceae bacterium ABcell3]